MEKRVDYQCLVGDFPLVEEGTLVVCLLLSYGDATVSIRAAPSAGDINELPLEIPIINAACFIGSGKPFRVEIKLDLRRQL